MQYYYSATTGGFYMDEIHGSNMPSDVIQLTENEYKNVIDNHIAGEIKTGTDGKPQVVAIEITTEEKISRMKRAVKNWMNTVVAERDYDSIEVACSYTSSSNSTWALEGQACATWRDSVWTAFYSITDEIIADLTAEELIAELPTLTWPE